MKTKITINNKEYEAEIKDEDVKKIEQGTEISVPSKVKLRPEYGKGFLDSAEACEQLIKDCESDLKIIFGVKEKE